MRYVLCLFVLGACCGMASATTYLVNPDGTGDYPTIQAAIDATADGDTVSLESGVFFGEGNRDIRFFGKAITLRSYNGDPAVCVIDCEGSETDPRRGIRFPAYEGIGPNTVVEGITITNGYGGDGGGVWGQDASPTFIRCVIVGNTSAQNGGGISIESSSDATPSFTDCVIIDNYAGFRGGGCFFQEVSPTLERCVIANNNGAYYGGGIVYGYGDGGLLVSQCTFAANSGSEGACVYIKSGASVILVNCILATGIIGESIYCEDGATAVLSCTDVWGNEGGDWVGCLAGQLGLDGNIEADPMFCADLNEDEPFSLSGESPCAPEYNPDCGLIGALPVECTLVGVSDHSPNLYSAALGQIYPNPFNPQTTITFALDKPQQAEVAVYDLTGRLLRVLADRSFEAGTHSAVWNGKDATGRVVPSGTYVVRLATDSTTQARKVMLLR